LARSLKFGALAVYGAFDIQDLLFSLPAMVLASHRPFRRRDRVVAIFREIKTLQKFALADAAIHNAFVNALGEKI